jgi:hypothetical protein
MSLNPLQAVALFEFSDDIGQGVTAMCAGDDDTIFVASGSSPAQVYAVSVSTLQVKSQVSVNEGAIVSLVYHASTKHLFAASETSINIYQVRACASTCSACF